MLMMVCFFMMTVIRYPLMAVVIVVQLDECVPLDDDGNGMHIDIRSQESQCLRDR